MNSGADWLRVEGLNQPVQTHPARYRDAGGVCRIARRDAPLVAGLSLCRSAPGLSLTRIRAFGRSLASSPEGGELRNARLQEVHLLSLKQLPVATFFGFFLPRASHAISPVVSPHGGYGTVL